MTARPATQPDAPTEARNPRTLDIDLVPVRDILRMLNEEDARVAVAVAGSLDDLARGVELAHDRVRSGGRVHYFGAGTSGRLAVLDAAELPPTFGLDADVVVAHHAGGAAALTAAAENVEDDTGLAERDAAGVSARDFVVGLTASGHTPYVRAALAASRRRGAATMLVTANPASPLAALVDVAVVCDTGPEAIAGSTRLKAGTAQKLVLNGFSTALMVRLGRTYSNLMVTVVATNAKLRRRSVNLLVEATGLPVERCQQALAEAAGDVRVALVSLLTGCGVAAARTSLTPAGGVVRDAVRGSTPPVRQRRGGAES
ncbi:MAG: N-acetylmuramic acid 6-phosphate etherase [Actinobacteria bacterium]|nr:N-acetylmuramic acid 6-phosphate etherase [Actinomycetota bacterium]